MKTLKSMVSMLAVAALFFASACGDDDEDDGPMVDPIVGSYVMTQVTLNEDLTYAGQTIPAGADITDIVEGLLFLESPCNDPSNTIIILEEEDAGLFYGCQNEDVDPVDFGTWSRDEASNSLTLFITIAGQDVPLRINDLVENNTSISGTIPSLLLPNAPGFNPPLVTANVNIIFTKIDN